MQEQINDHDTVYQAENVFIADDSSDSEGVTLPILLDKRIINVPHQAEKSGNVLSTDGTNLNWIKTTALRQDPLLRTAAFTAVANTCYNIGWLSTNYAISLPTAGLVNGDQLRFQNLDQSFGGTSKRASITPPLGQKINGSTSVIYLQEAGTDMLLTFHNGNWAMDLGGATQQNTSTLIPGSVYWKFNTINGVTTYTLPAPALPHSDKELYSVNQQGVELLATQFSINQAQNKITLTVAPEGVQPVKVRCWLKHKDATTSADNAFPVGYVGLFDPTVTPSATHWKEFPAGDTLCISTTTNFPRFGAIRGVAYLTDGRIAVIAGHDWETGYTNECYLGTIDENKCITWVKSPSVYPVSQGYVQCTTLNNGKILAVAGYPNDGNCYLGTVSGDTITWAATTKYPASAMYTNCLLKLQDGRCVSLCGIENGLPTNKCFITSATGAGWTATTNYPITVQSMCACVLPNGKILTVGGWNGSAPDGRCYIGTVSGNSISWTPTTNYPLGGIYGGQVGIVGNKIIIIGGININEGLVTTACIGTYTAASNKLVWTTTDRHGLQNFTYNQNTLVNISPTQVISVGGDYNTNMSAPIDTVCIFEIQKAYQRI